MYGVISTMVLLVFNTVSALVRDKTKKTVLKSEENIVHAIASTLQCMRYFDDLRPGWGG